MSAPVLWSLTAWLAVPVVLGGAAWLGLRAVEHRFVYFPTPLSADAEPPPLAHGTVRELHLTAADGVRLHGWHVRAHRPSGATLLFFHGNGGNLMHRAPHLDGLAARGLDVLIIDYRGYGKSAGAPSERGLYLDAEAAYAWLRDEAGVPPERIVLFGESLGTAVAVELAVRRPAAGLVLDSPFTSFRDMGRAHYRWLPNFVYDSLDHRLDSASKIGELTMPLLVVHGEHDEIVPLALGRELYLAAPEPREFVPIPYAGHHNLPFVGGERYYGAVAEFALRVTAG